MSSLFVEAFLQMFEAIAKILLVAIAAAMLIKKNLFKEQYIKGLSDLVVVVLLPAMIFDNITSTFDPWSEQYWWILPLLGLLTPVVSLLFVIPLYLKNLKDNLNKLPFASFQNAGYLVLPIGQLLFPREFPQFAQYVFLYLIGLNLSLWSIGKFLITSSSNQRDFSIMDFISPPFVANVFSLSLVFLKVNNYVPSIITEPIKMLGSATVPLATFVLGATIGSITITKFIPIADLLKILSVKYLIVPAITIFILLQIGLHHKNMLLADFLVIEASAAPAANLILMVRKYGGDSQLSGSVMLVAYLAAIVFMPLALGVWKWLITIF